MTGNNHYPDCTCGWCVNSGRSGVNRDDLKASYRVHEAEAFLKRNGARSIAGCYVNPNAKCPVCDAAVFFYANASGSRVYFDDLGPPWPKHPCTDNPSRRIKEHATYTGRPVRRSPGIVYELIEATRIAGSLRNTHGRGGRWTLLVLVSVNRRGTKNTILAEHLETDHSQRVTVTCHSDDPIFEIGDFLSMRGNQFSFFDKVSMSSFTFAKGGRVVRDAIKTALPERAKTALKPVAPRASVTPGPVPEPGPAPSATRTYDMTKKEMSHFHSKQKSVQQLCDQMLPIVRSYAKDGIRKPRQVAEMLNRQGHRTVLGAKWTPRLTYFLLGLVFMPSNKPAPPKSMAAVNPVNRRPAPPGPMTMEDIAARLSRLGRVVLSQDRSDEPG